ncbi:MAG: hypothetical protein JWQ90_5534 [Hydrocarboniphaga sp.]|nr:hypothetical protein [Hydrocarboniphaga sp.]
MATVLRHIRLGLLRGRKPTQSMFHSAGKLLDVYGVTSPRPSFGGTKDDLAALEQDGERVQDGFARTFKRVSSTK